MRKTYISEKLLATLAPVERAYGVYKKIGVHKPTVWKWTKRGLPVHRNAGGEAWICTHELRDWLKKNDRLKK